MCPGPKTLMLLAKKTHQDLYFLRRLNKFGTSPMTLTNFNRSYPDAWQLGLAIALLKIARNCRVVGTAKFHDVNQLSSHWLHLHFTLPWERIQYNQGLFTPRLFSLLPPGRSHKSFFPLETRTASSLLLSNSWKNLSWIKEVVLITQSTSLWFLHFYFVCIVSVAVF